MKNIFNTIRKYHMIAPGMRVLAGVSGGADSVCLLHVLHLYRREVPFALMAVHVEHGIRGTESLADAAFVQRLCAGYGIPCRTVHTDVCRLAREQRLSLEEAGRAERYRIFGELCQEWGADRIAVAHHQGDQAETVLWNLIRGSGLKGLGGIRPVRGAVIRPLLSVTREEILEILKEAGLSWREDRTNQELDYTRNRLRLQVLPLLEAEINEQAAAHIAQAGVRLQQVQDYIDKMTAQAQQRCLYTERGEVCLRLEPFGQEEPLIRTELLKRAVELCTVESQPKPESCAVEASPKPESCAIEAQPEPESCAVEASPEPESCAVEASPKPESCAVEASPKPESCAVEASPKPKSCAIEVQPKPELHAAEVPPEIMPDTSEAITGAEFYVKEPGPEIRKSSGMRDIGAVHLEMLHRLAQQDCGKSCNLPGGICAVRENGQIRFFRGKLTRSRKPEAVFSHAKQSPAASAGPAAPADAEGVLFHAAQPPETSAGAVPPADPEGAFSHADQSPAAFGGSAAPADAADVLFHADQSPAVPARPEAVSSKAASSAEAGIALTVPGVTAAGRIRVRTELLPNTPELKSEIKKEKKYTKWLSYDTIKCNVRLRTRQTGDYLVIDGRGARKKLKDDLIDRKIPRSRRDELLLLADGSHILWMIGIRISEAAKVTQETRQVLKIQLEVESDEGESQDFIAGTGSKPENRGDCEADQR